VPRREAAVLDDTTAGWWYEQDGQQAGPVTAAGIGRLVAEGRLGPAHRVWRDGMSGWEPLGSVAELAEALPPARVSPPAPPPLAPPPSGPTGERPSGPGAAAQGAPPSASAPRSALPPHAGAAPTAQGPFAGGSGAPSAYEEISPGIVVLLSLVTFGIYGLVKFHQTGKGYEALAGRTSNFSRDFWLSVGLGVASGATVHTIFLGGPLSVASLVFGVLALSDALTLRDEVLHRTAVRPSLTDPGTHKALFVLGCLLAPILVGVVLLVVQAWKWFSDWNAVGIALSQRSAPAVTAETVTWR
jgi:hypothetical protein